MRTLLRSMSIFLAAISLGTAVNAQTARLQVIHNSADLAAATVDVWLNDGPAPLLDDFAFRNASPFIDAPAGVPFDVTIQPSNSTDTTNGLYRETFTLTAGETYVLIATGIVSATGYNPATPFSLEVFNMGREASANGSAEVDLLVFHGSTDAPTVDVFESSVPAGTLVDNASYGDFAGYLELGVNDYVIQVRNENNSAIVAAYSAPLATLMLGGAASVVVASGFLDPAANSNGSAFGLFVATPFGGAMTALPPVNIPTARVQVIHNSADPIAAVVDVWLNDQPLADDFAFRTATPFVDVQAGVDLDVSVALPTSTDTVGAIAKFNYNLEDGETYQLIASGVALPTGFDPVVPFDVHVFAGAREAAATAGNTDVLVYHGSTDAPTVDVTESAAGAGTIVSGLSYSDFDGYLELATADYLLNVVAGGATVASYGAPLSTLSLDDAAITVVASGFLDPSVNSNGAAFGLWASVPAGGPLVELPVVTSVDDEAQAAFDAGVRLYPNPASTQVRVEVGADSPSTLQVTDLSGRVLQELLVANSNVIDLNVGEFTKG
ncbi:MAG: DUF4397 domain-containing protein, partial [Bacteroidota bacterium]